MNIYCTDIFKPKLVKTVIIVRYFNLIQYTMNLNLLMCVTLFISTPTARTHIINYGLLKQWGY